MPELLLLLLATAPLPAAALNVLALHDATAWRLDNSAGFANVSLDSVSVPAAVLQLLQQAGVIGDPLYRCMLTLRQYWHRVLRWLGCPPAAAAASSAAAAAALILPAVC